MSGDDPTRRSNGGVEPGAGGETGHAAAPAHGQTPVRDMEYPAPADGGHRRRGVLDRALYALFSRHADRRRHAADRKRYRATDVRLPFGVYLSRVYGLSWLAFAAGVGLVLIAAAAVPDAAVAGVGTFIRNGVPLLGDPGVPHPPPAATLFVAAVGVGAVCKRATILLGGRYLQWVARARRADINRTLPGAVRYLRALSSGSDDRRAMLARVADNRDAYGETAVALRKALNKAALTGSLNDGLAVVARDTPSREALSPFLHKFREHADQGADALRSYLRMESRMLSHRQRRSTERAQGFLELLSELFIVLLVLPCLLVIVLTVMSVLSPDLTERVATPFGRVPVRTLLAYGSAAFVLCVGAISAWLVVTLRPAAHGGTTHRAPPTIAGTLRTALTNPASATVTFAPLAAVAGAVLWSLGHRPVDVLLLSYVAVAVPVGLVAVRRARRDDAKDREIKDFVHAVSGHVGLGRPFPEAVALVARDVDLGALQPDVADLAFNANLTTGPRAEAGTSVEGPRRGPGRTDDAGDRDVRTAAIERFTDRVGTPLAEQTMGLVSGALAAGSDAEEVFDTLQSEVGRLYHEKKAMRSSMLVYVAVGWTTALLIVGIVVAVDGHVIGSFSQLSAVSDAQAGFAIDPDAIEPARERHRFYVVTQATMLACGWFAGAASRGRYEALLHSGLLVAVAYVVFAGVGMV